MNLSGIVVTTAAEHLHAVAAALAALPGVEVHRADEAGRLVIVQEAANVGVEIESFERIRALPHVVSAELVYHYLEDQDTGVRNDQSDPS
jgi:nitrate reductase NapD